MHMPLTENRWTTGNILTLALLLLNMLVLGGGGLWAMGKTESLIERNSERIDQNATDIAEVERNQRAIEATVSASVTQYGRMDERLIAMQAVLISIQTKLERIVP